MAADLKLYPYQEDGVEFLTQRRRAYLADEMGLGKTAQAIVAARRLGLETVLVICPAVAVENWKREWATLWPGGPPVRVISYAKAIRRIRRPARPDFWDLVILDEAHYFKTPSAKRTRVALKMAQRASRAWLMSGTPTPNDVTELWPPVKYLWPEIAEAFKVRTAFQWLHTFTHYEMTEFGPRVFGLKNGDALRPHLQKVMLRRRLAEVGLDLPPLRVDTSLLRPDVLFRKAIEAQGYLPEEIEQAMELADEEGVLSTLRRFLGQYKAPLVSQILVDELRDEPALQMVVLAHHRDTLRVLFDGFQRAKISLNYVDGDISGRSRDNAVTNFQTGKARVFLAQQTTAGLAINLQNAHELVLVEPSWCPADNAQAIKRIHRIGQDSPCRARIFSVAGTLDERIMDVLARKTRMAAELEEEA
jgi:SNF2 family DNA or RNA helicase